MSSDRSFDVLIVGAGPAGIAAACAAAECGVRVGIVDDNPAPGGQIWRNEANPKIEQLRRSGASFLSQTTIFDSPQRGVLLANSGGSVAELAYRSLVLATGARELWIPFPGWTLPNVLGAGGLQALVKGGLPIAGKRVVVCGSGPLLLAVADYLHRKGAEVLLVAEQASTRSLASFSSELVRHPAKAVQAVGLRWRLRSVPYRTGCWPTEAHGDNKLESVVIGTQELRCDFLACGFGLIPNTELPELLGCAVENGRVEVDEVQRTSIEHIYCAGEAAGIGGSESALVQGTIAGYAAAGQSDRAKRHFGQRKQAQRFSDALNNAFALRPELKTLPTPDTIVCWCEDVSWRRLQVQPGWRAAKLQTRCGMGPCQGRVCGPALQFLAGWGRSSVRPPLYPVPVQLLTREK